MHLGDVSVTIDDDMFVRLLQGLFDFSPVAICVSSIGAEQSRYVRVNEAYLKLVGRSWEELIVLPLKSAGVAIDDARRRRRLHLLDSVGHYELEEVEITHSSGRVLSTLISAQRFIDDGNAYDIELIIDVTIRKVTERALWRAANIDGLTGLWNRSAFIERMNEAAERRRASGGVLILALIDIDNFKLVNDRNGHMAGDRSLVEAAEAISVAVGEHGIAGRLGGDEFAILLREESDVAAGYSKIESIGAMLNSEAPALDGERVRPTVTIGYAAMPLHAETPDALMRAADVALYRGKARGRATTVVFDPDEPDPAPRRSVDDIGIAPVRPQDEA